MLRTIKRYMRSRLVAGTAIIGLGLAATACAGETAGPETGADIEDIQQDFEALEDRVGTLEEDVAELREGFEGAAEDDVGMEDAQVFDDPESFVGQQVTVSAKVTEVFSPAAFNLTGDDVGGEPLLVIGATGPTNVEQGQVVQVTGTVRAVETGVFEDIGFTPDDEFFSAFGVEDEAGFVTEFGGEHLIAASQVQVLEGGDAGTGQETEGDGSS